MGAEGAKEEIANALWNNRTLTELGLESNRIGTEGARAFEKAVLKNRTLAVLKLEDNGISADGVKALEKAEFAESYAYRAVSCWQPYRLPSECELVSACSSHCRANIILSY